MPMVTRTNGFVSILKNRADADGPAGLGSLHSAKSTRVRTVAERMKNADKTEFNDTIAIVGQPQWIIPIGIATFLCRVSGDFRQPDVIAATAGNGDAHAMFAASSMTSGVDAQGWAFPTMAGPQLGPIFRMLTVEIVFPIGGPIEMKSLLRASKRERSPWQDAGDLDATIEIETVLQPIVVVGVTDPVAVTQTTSGTKYYCDAEPGARDVPLRGCLLKFSHD